MPESPFPPAQGLKPGHTGACLGAQTRRGQLTWLRVAFSSPTDVITVSEKTVCPVWLLVLYNRTGTVRVKQKGLWANPTTFLLFPEAGEPRQTPSLPSRQRNSLPSERW